ncbi:MAG: hypothetical protein LBH58_00880 [Tannerellaceae bacterium]|jgi:hypothetical protein|nr:hypothetical protein [Tannerellaceae bacterium]
MDKKWYELLIKNIIASIPPNIKPANYLMDVLDIGKDSVYRRLKGEVPFSLEEIVSILQLLDVSLDEATGLNRAGKLKFNDLSSAVLSNKESFVSMVEKYIGFLSKKKRTHSSITVTATNRFPIAFSLGLEYLFKFFYYKWVYQSDETPSNVLFEDVNIPDNIKQLCSKIKSYFMTLNDHHTHSIVLSPNIYSQTIREIQYYYKRKLISLDEIKLIQKDFSDQINKIEKMAQTGVNDFGANYFLYLSSLNIESNCTCLKTDNAEWSYFWTTSSVPVETSESTICNMNYDWIESLKKYSTLITKSNELLQAAFFDKQRYYINNMHKL